MSVRCSHETLVTAASYRAGGVARLRQSITRDGAGHEPHTHCRRPLHLSSSPTGSRLDIPDLQCGQSTGRTMMAMPAIGSVGAGRVAVPIRAPAVWAMPATKPPG